MAGHDIIVVGGSAGALEGVSAIAGGLPAGLPAADVEPVRLGEHGRIAVGRPDTDQHVGVRGQRHALQLDRLGGPAPPVDHRRVVAQHLLDRARDQPWVRAQRRPAVPVLQQPPQRVAEQVGRRLVAGQQQPEQDRRDLLLVQRLTPLVRRVDEVGREVVARPCSPVRRA